MMLIFTALLAITPTALRAQGEVGLGAIRGPALSAHVRFLADDRLEGRGTGTRGHEIAARYLATQLAALGVEPAAEGGSFLQTVPLRGFTADVARSSLQFHMPGNKISFTNDALILGSSGDSGDADVSGPIAFAGFGIANKAAGYDDVGDVKGRIAIVLSGAPDPGSGGIGSETEAAVRGYLGEKMRVLRERGALAVLYVRSPLDEKRYPWTMALKHSRKEQMVWREGERVGIPQLPSVGISMIALDKLLAVAGRKETSADLFARGKTGGLKPFAIDARAHLTVHHKVRDLSSENVVGLLRGSDPVLSKEAVVFSAHVDHLGIGEPDKGDVKNDTIYNGADDDASGVAALIEIARAFATLPKRPPRSILFLGVTAEEMGMRGSDYFAHHPTLPLGDLVADINLDGPAGYWQLHDLTALGEEHSTLHAAVAAACKALGLELSPDPMPEQVYFIRSDQFSFVKKGVPSIFPGAGFLDQRGKRDWNQGVDQSMHAARYHRPTDEWDPKRNWEWVAEEVRADFLIGLAVALDPERPRWNPGDPFERMYGVPGVAPAGAHPLVHPR